VANAECVLVVDDDRSIREMLAEYLSSEGYRVVLAEDGVAMRAEIERAAPDLVLLDLKLPNEDGLSLARFLRERYDVGIIMVTGAGGVVDRIVGLEVGADDYLAKPFSPRELLARLRALLRRSQAPAAAHAAEIIEFGPFRLDVGARRLLRDQADVDLSAAEFDLMKVFAERPGRVLSRDVLLDLLKGYERDPFDRTVDIRVGRLRRKIETDPANPVYIRTVRGEGYMFNPRGDIR
jgi:DNA-binding response OmpR family regulator